ncbi:MAG TPA: CBS domain-containing protein [Candidatus Saccharimonadales bacterium]|nr:CBS domain-containing protein [Candidatus Saccharimonadales bacterium]
MNVGHMITKQLVTINSDKTILDAARMMVSHNMGLLVVMDPTDAGKLVAVISERDIIRALASEKRVDIKIGEVGTRNVITVKIKADVAEAAKAMNKNRIRHVVVVDEYERAVGVVSMRDLVGERTTLKAILQSQEKEVFVGGD